MGPKAAALLVGLLVWGSATAQPADGFVIDDPVGDLAHDGPAGSTPAPPGTHDHADIEQMWITEGPDDLIIGLDMVEWGPSSGPPGRYKYVRFTFEDQWYQVLFPRFEEDAAILQTGPDGLTWHALGNLETSVDPADAIVQARVPKDIVTDPQGQPLRFGQSISSIHGHGVSWATLIANSEVYEDFAPDADRPSLTMARGAVIVDDMVLSSPAPVRPSNGESTTFVFPVTIDNLGGSARSLALEVDVDADTVQADVPALVEVPANATVTVPVVVAMEFAHQHGGAIVVNLRASPSAAPELTETLPLTIQFHEVPQPAGHHPVVYFHSAPLEGNPYDLEERRAVWMAATSEPQRTDADNAPVEGNGAPSWRIPLQPALQIGLDFDTNATAALKAVIEPGTGAIEGSLSATLWHCQPGDETGQDPGRFGCPRGSWTLLAYGASPTAAVAGGEPHELAIDMTIEDVADFIPYAPGAALRLDLHWNAEGEQPLVSPPRLVVAESSLFLPLHEYQDPIDQGFLEVGDLRLVAGSAFERMANPGDALVFAFRLHNDGDVARSVALQALGPDADWGAWTQDEVRVGAGDAVSLQYVVEVPSDAVAGQGAEIMVVAQDSQRPQVVALSRLRAVVVDDPDIPDERHLIEGVERQAPAILPLLPLAAWALLRRKRPAA